MEALPAEARDLWTLVRDATSDVDADDLRRLETVVALREVDSARFFERVGGGWDILRRQLYGDEFTLHALLALLPPGLTVADLGCGTGQALSALAPHVRRAIGVDRESAMLEAAAHRLADVENVELRRGGLDALPLADAEVDAALCMLVLHHVDPLPPAFAEMARVLTAGGRCVVLDMVAHDQVEYRETMGHKHLGFAPEDVSGLAAGAGLRVTSHRALPAAADALGPPLFVAVLERAYSSV
jgi:ArsR family transcriptional regulator